MNGATRHIKTLKMGVAHIDQSGDKLAMHVKIQSIISIILQLKKE